MGLVVERRKAISSSEKRDKEQMMEIFRWTRKFMFGDH